jgi:hypothetical protein
MADIEGRCNALARAPALVDMAVPKPSAVRKFLASARRFF